MKSCKLHFVAHRENVPVALEVEWKKSSQENEGPHCVCVGRPSSTTRSDGSKKRAENNQGFLRLFCKLFLPCQISRSHAYFKRSMLLLMRVTFKLGQYRQIGSFQNRYITLSYFFLTWNFNAFEFQFLKKIQEAKQQSCRSVGAVRWF